MVSVPHQLNNDAIHGSRHCRVALRASLLWPSHYVPPVNAGEVDSDNVLLSVVDDAPWVAFVRAAALKLPLVLLLAGRPEPVYLGSLSLGPVIGMRRDARG